MEKVNMKKSLETKVKHLESKVTQLEGKVQQQERQLHNLTKQLAAADEKKIPVVSLSTSVVSSNDNNRQMNVIYRTCHEARAAD